MRSTTCALLLLLGGLLLAAGNLWCTALRSTIPREIDQRLLGKRRYLEHSRGVDDVCLLDFAQGRWIQVDPAVFEPLTPGEQLRKRAWERQLAHGGSTLPLAWSRDFRRMAWAMPAVMGVLAALAACAVLRPSRRSLPGEAGPAARHAGR